jgi:hypothetical protein
MKPSTAKFFQLVASLSKAAVILGLDNILDRSNKGSKLTIERLIDGITDPETKKICTQQLKQIRESECYRAIKIARNHLVAHSVRATVIRYDDILAAGEDKTSGFDYRKLSLPHLEYLLRDVADLSGRALGKLPSEFLHQDWKGVSQLFDRLRHLKV